jgi:predicted nucleic acid-binding protein
MGWRPCSLASGAGDAVTLIDTTVWIDFFRGTDTAQVQELERMLNANEDVCVCGVVLTEVLQGIRDEKEYANALVSFDSFILLPMTRATFVRAAELYRTLRRRGLTVRNAVDCMIAAVALEHDVALLHNDRDFDAIASLGKLKIVEPEKPTTPRSLRRVPRRK